MAQRLGITKLVTWTFIALIVLYTAVAVSPLPEFIGRSNPSASAWFSPPLFNFRANYDDGVVLGIPIGASKNEVAKLLESKGLQNLRFVNACGGGLKHGPYVITFKEIDRLLAWGSDENTWCVRTTKPPISAVFYFHGNNLVKVRLTISNFEGT